jgi:hypothetical protein
MIFVSSLLIDFNWLILDKYYRLLNGPGVPEIGGKGLNGNA